LGRRRGTRATAPLSANLRVLRGDAPDAQPANPTLEGFATVYEQPYQMWDAYGPYTEIVSAGAGEKTLAANPDVKYLFNHRGMPMASTGTGTLTLTKPTRVCTASPNH
jgi:phage head maturation protease